MDIILNLIYIILLSICTVYNVKEAIRTRRKKKCIIYAIVAGICIATLVSRCIYVVFDSVKPPMIVE